MTLDVKVVGLGKLQRAGVFGGSPWGIRFRVQVAMDVGSQVGVEPKQEMPIGQSLTIAGVA